MNNVLAIFVVIEAIKCFEEIIIIIIIIIIIQEAIELQSPKKK